MLNSLKTEIQFLNRMFAGQSRRAKCGSYEQPAFVSIVRLGGQSEQLEPRCVLAASLGGLWTGQSGFVMDPSQSISTSSGRQITHASMIQVGTEIRAYATDGIPDGDTNPNNDKYGVRLFTSTDGLRWNDRGMVLTPRVGTYYDQMCSFPGVSKVGTTYYMVFESQKLGATADIGLATSNDGLNWTVASQPILRHTGSGFERANIGTPSLYYANGQFTLFYHAFDYTDCRLHAATGSNLANLTRVNNGWPIIDTSPTGIDSGTIGKRSQIFAEAGYFYMAIEVSSDQTSGGYAGSNWSTILVRSRSLTSGWEKLVGTVLPTTGTGFGFDGPEMANVNGQLRLYARDKSGQTRIATLSEATTRTFEAERDLQHQIGRIDRDGWAVRVGDAPSRFLSFGPYTTAVASGNRQATFRLMIDNNVADAARVLTIDVFDAATGTVLAKRDINRRQFNIPMTYQDFTLGFSAAAGQRLEFRVFWHGGAYVRENYVRVR